MKTKLLLISIITTLALASCTLPDTEGESPLERPYDRQSAAQLHEQNVQIITGNPGYRLP